MTGNSGNSRHGGPSKRRVKPAPWEGGGISCVLGSRQRSEGGTLNHGRAGRFRDIRRLRGDFAGGVRVSPAGDLVRVAPAAEVPRSVGTGACDDGAEAALRR